MPLCYCTPVHLIEVQNRNNLVYDMIFPAPMIINLTCGWALQFIYAHLCRIRDQINLVCVMIHPYWDITELAMEDVLFDNCKIWLLLFWYCNQMQVWLWLLHGVKCYRHMPGLMFKRQLSLIIDQSVSTDK